MGCAAQYVEHKELTDFEYEVSSSEDNTHR